MNRPRWTLPAMVLMVSACQPSSLTEARDQLGRRAEDILSLILPLVDTTYLVSELLADDLDTTTTANGLLGISQSDTVVTAIGDSLLFNGVGLDQFSFGYDQLLQTEEVSVGVSSPPAATGTVVFGTPGGSAVVGATVDTGWVVRTIVNNTDCDANVTATLVDDNATPVVVFPVAVVNAGQTAIDSVDASNASFAVSIDVNTMATFGACVPTPGPTVMTTMTFRPLQLASVDLQNINETFQQIYDLLQSESRLQNVDTMEIASGSLTLTASNRLPIPITFDILLNGFLDQSGTTLRDSVTVVAAPGDGTYTSASIVFDLAGVTLLPAEAQATANGRAFAAQATINQAVVANAVLADGTGDVVAAVVAGDLDPAQTPELRIDVEELSELDAGDYDFDDLEDAIRSSTLNNGQIDLAIRNTANAPVRVANFAIGAVQLDGAGQPLRDGSGNLMYETDAGGNPILISVVDPGQTTLSVARQTTTAVTVGASTLVDRVIHLLIDDVRVGVVATGTAEAGDGTYSRFTQQDFIEVAYDVVVGFDLTIPIGGVTFTRNQTADGLDLSDADARDIANRLVTAGLTGVVHNSTPFGVEIEIALAPGSLGEGTDVFAHPNAVVLDMLTLSAAQTDANGVPQTSAMDSVRLAISGGDISVVLGPDYTAGIRLRLVPRSNGGRRGAVRPQDGVRVKASVEVQVRRGTP